MLKARLRCRDIPNGSIESTQNWKCQLLRPKPKSRYIGSHKNCEAPERLPRRYDARAPPWRPSMAALCGHRSWSKMVIFFFDHCVPLTKLRMQAHRQNAGPWLALYSSLNQARDCIYLLHPKRKRMNKDQSHRSRYTGFGPSAPFSTKAKKRPWPPISSDP
jgi:hypothetical protein